MGRREPVMSMSMFILGKNSACAAQLLCAIRRGGFKNVPRIEGAGKKLRSSGLPDGMKGGWQDA